MLPPYPRAYPPAYPPGDQRFSSQANRLTVEIVQDLICPWCYLGLRRLLKALARRPDLNFALIWQPFLLNPDMPAQGLPHAMYAVRKFGGEDRARRLYATIRDIGRQEEIDFAFDKISRIPSSVNAHRLLEWAARQGRGAAMAEALFAAHFTKGLDIGDAATLAAIAHASGLSAMDARLFLESDQDAERIHADNLQAHRLGINGVPCMVIDGTHAIAGAQDPDVLERLLDVVTVKWPQLTG